jgi:hypothetical protein
MNRNKSFVESKPSNKYDMNQNDFRRSFDHDKPLKGGDYYKLKADKEMKNYFEDKIKEVRGQYEVRLSSLREDIYKKERELYDLKNNVNLINLKLNKESESRESIENNLKNANNQFSSEAEQ